MTSSLIDSSLPSYAIDQQVSERSGAADSLYRLDVDLIRSLQPDLIVTQAQCDVCAVRYADVIDFVRSEARLAHTQVIALNPTSLDEVLADLVLIGEVTGLEAHAAGFLTSLQNRIEAVSARTAALTTAERPRTACIEWIEPLMFAANWTPQLIELAGGQSGLAEAGKHSAYGSWGDLLRNDPEVLIISPCGFDFERSIQEAKILTSNPKWNALSAVRNERTWVIDGNAYLNRPGPRLVDSLEILAHLMHPALIDRPSWSDPNSLPWGRPAS